MEHQETAGDNQQVGNHDALTDAYVSVVIDHCADNIGTASAAVAVEHKA